MVKPSRSGAFTRRTLDIGVAAIGAYLLSYDQAHAYLDPGTGSVLLQLLLGGVAGIAMAGRIYWARIKEMLGIRPKPEAARIEPK
jgi:hypothetical protein